MEIWGKDIRGPVLAPLVRGRRLDTNAERSIGGIYNLVETDQVVVRYPWHRCRRCVSDSADGSALPVRKRNQHEDYDGKSCADDVQGPSLIRSCPC